MNENEHNFDELKQLLKLKRHEIPPPGYFHNFSGNVIAGIHAERDGTAKSRTASTNWFTRLMNIFETRPGLVGGFATSLVLVLVGGVVITDHSDSDSANIFLPNGVPGDSATVTPTGTGMSPMNMASIGQSSSGGISISTNPITSLQPMPSLFGQANPLFQTASFAPAQ